MRLFFCVTTEEESRPSGEGTKKKSWTHQILIPFFLIPTLSYFIKKRKKSAIMRIGLPPLSSSLIMGGTLTQFYYSCAIGVKRRRRKNLKRPKVVDNRNSFFLYTSLYPFPFNVRDCFPGLFYLFFFLPHYGDIIYLSMPIYSRFRARGGYRWIKKYKE